MFPSVFKFSNPSHLIVQMMLDQPVSKMMNLEDVVP